MLIQKGLFMSARQINGEQQESSLSLFATYLKWCRTCRPGKRPLTISQLARKSEGSGEPGVSAAYISNLETGAQSNPSGDKLDKLANALELNPFEREILHRSAGNTSSLFVPGLDVPVENSLLFQKDKRVKEVFLVAENVKERDKDNMKFLKQVVGNIDRGVKYRYCLDDKDNFEPLKNDLEDMLDPSVVRKMVTCITASNYFVFRPGFIIIRCRDPHQLIGLYAKWFDRTPYRVYEMEEAVCQRIYRILENVHLTLENDMSTESQWLGHVTKVFPKK
jgi:transcriptional regulator with XRE-family HTH domain